MLGKNALRRERFRSELGEVLRQTETQEAAVKQPAILARLEAEHAALC
jgi:hypothetical protein